MDESVAQKLKDYKEQFARRSLSPATLPRLRWPRWLHLYLKKQFVSRRGGTSLDGIRLIIVLKCSWKLLSWLPSWMRRPLLTGRKAIGNFFVIRYTLLKSLLSAVALFVGAMVEGVGCQPLNLAALGSNPSRQSTSKFLQSPRSYGAFSGRGWQLDLLEKKKRLRWCANAYEYYPVSCSWCLSSGPEDSFATAEWQPGRKNADLRESRLSIPASRRECNMDLYLLGIAMWFIWLDVRWVDETQLIGLSLFEQCTANVRNPTIFITVSMNMVPYNLIMVHFVTATTQPISPHYCDALLIIFDSRLALRTV